MRREKGEVRDFKLYKDSVGKGGGEPTPIQADLGCPGTASPRSNSKTPINPCGNRKLNEREKTYNKGLAMRRVAAGHVNVKIKTFKIMAYPYRDHCGRRLPGMTPRLRRH
jgi:hypothetical protein